jgi:hypothetical protein
MIRLLGARKFIGLPTGTLYKEFWLNNEEECEKMISEFTENPSNFLDTENLMIYQDNSGSLVLNDPFQGDEICLIDINVVGDAAPSCTLRIVFDLEDLPETINVGKNDEDVDMSFTKDEIKEFIKIMKDYADSDKQYFKWALDELDELYKDGNKIVDIDLKYCVDKNT